MSDEKNPTGKTGGAAADGAALSPEAQAAIIAKKDAAGAENMAAKTAGGAGTGATK